MSLVAEADNAAIDEYGEKEALEWAGGYVFPQSLLDSHVRCLQAAQLDFISMGKRRFQIVSENRLNKNRVAALRSAVGGSQNDGSGGWNESSLAE